MIRLIARRLLATPSPRPFSTSSYILGNHRNPPNPPDPQNPSNRNPPPSPAERPPPPESSTPSPVFETIVNNAADPRPPTEQSNDIIQPIAPTPPPPTKPDLSKLPSLDIDPSVALPEPETDGEVGERRRTGAGRKAYVSSIERQRRAYLRYGLGALVLGGLGAVYWVGRDDGTANQAEGDVTGHMARVRSNFTELFDYFNKPAFKVLLPDALPPPHQRPYTLVIDLEGLLVSSSWDRTSGWRTAKRPGVDYFLAYLSQFYEIVLFTSQPLYTAAPVAEKLDPYQAYLPYKLFRDSTRSVSGKTVKDLSYLNRDLSKVVMLDINEEHAALQPENAIIIKPWEGKGGDKGLVDLIPFLESIGIFSPADVRPILKAYSGKDIPTEYAKKEAEAKRVAVEEWERLHPSAMHGAGSGYLTSMFGSVAAPGQTRPNQPMTYLEQKRAQAQRIYQEEQKYWADNAEAFKKLIEDDKQRQLAEMKGSLLGFLSGGPGGAKPPGTAK